jgi:acetolactate synthase-1/3 small subunit
MSKHVISVKVENRSGVLARVAGLFSARGYNIDSLTVSETEQPDISVMTIVVKGDDRVLEQVKKQLNKLIDVIKVSDHSSNPSVQSEAAGDISARGDLPRGDCRYIEKIRHDRGHGRS